VRVTNNNEERSLLLDTQFKSWAELTPDHKADDATTYTEKNCQGNGPPRTEQFLSTENQTNMSAPDSMNLTPITQEDLTAMEQ
jgi:hypothetical protein